MKGKVFWLSIVAVVISFAGGFLMANALNRNEMNQLRAENGRLTAAQTEAKQDESGLSLSDEEVRDRIAEADKNPSAAAFQKNLGLALYRYAAMKQNADLLAEVSRLLNRAFENNPKDYDVVVTLGNIYFDIGYFKKDNAQFEKAREFYQKALEQKPNDVDVRTDLGLTYFLTVPPEYEKAIAEFQKSLQSNPKHEKTLQVIAQTLLAQNKVSEAEKYVARLKEANADNQYLAQLESQIANVKSTPQN
ncbi:MAG: tetratricopeptide repeat protein [Pyrinomonadaceae bacterium]|nr:tetratricopeptide repeat protein [Pyrinomonadaceae bacterium]